MTAEESDILVLGVGNLLWADEGFGVRCVESLDAGWVMPPRVRLMDGGTQGLYLLPYVEAARRLLVFDAVDYGLAPGTLRVVEDDEVPRFMGAKKMSLHQTGFQEVIACAALHERLPQRMVLIGVQPVELDDYGGSLRPQVKAQIPAALDIALQHLRAWGVEAQQRATPRASTLNTASLDIARYEAGRPSAADACRLGDDRFLPDPPS